MNKIVMEITLTFKDSCPTQITDFHMPLLVCHFRRLASFILQRKRKHLKQQLKAKNWQHHPPAPCPPPPFPHLNQTKFQEKVQRRDNHQRKCSRKKGKSRQRFSRKTKSA